MNNNNLCTIIVWKQSVSLSNQVSLQNVRLAKSSSISEDC